MTQTETDLKKWQQQQARFQKIFGDQAIQDKGFQKIKLQELEKIYQKNRRSADPVEKATLQWLKVGNKNLEKILYPGFSQIALRRLIQFAGRIARRKTKPVKANVAPQSPVSRSWMQKHVDLAAVPVKRSATKGIASAGAKAPRIRVPETSNNGVHISR